MFKKVIGLIAGFLALMFVVTLCQLKAETQTTAKELENKVIVYTTYDKEMTDIVKSEFEKSTSINVEIKKFANDTEMVNEIKDKKGTVPDVILGVSTNTCEELKKDNLLEANKPSWYSDVNDNQKDKEGYWYSLFASPIVMFYNTAVIKGEMVPQNLMALSDKKYANLVVMPKVESNDFKYFLNTVIAPYVKDNKVDDGFKALAALKFNIKEYKEPGNQVIDAVAKKEGAVGFADLVKVNEAIKKGSTLAVVYGTEKYPVITEGIAIMKNGSNSNAAKLFEEFAAGPKMQYKIANKFKFNPTNKKALELCGGEVSELKDRTYKIDMN
ncbi:MAG: extracellular solute-binding protein, partial [Inconstantimicrobium porci]|uniref:ABC transporter substrate-binding protein n=1 Tax=Inconstantimicrobium porci TaxID=2652291 RepID=UPI002A90B87F